MKLKLTYLDNKAERKELLLPDECRCLFIELPNKDKLQVELFTRESEGYNSSIHIRSDGQLVVKPLASNTINISTSRY